MFDIEAPWHSYFKKIYNLFSVDSEITLDSELTENDDGSFEFTISSKNGDKLNAIENILGYGRVFGGIKVLIKYGYENKEEKNWADIYEKAFSGNPLFEKVEKVDLPFYGEALYAVFKKNIISFYDDNLSDYHGNSHYIVADVVSDVAVNNDIFICTSNV